MQAGFQSSEGTAFGRGTISACVEPEERHNYHQTPAPMTPLRRHTGHGGSGETFRSHPVQTCSQLEQCELRTFTGKGGFVSS